MFLNRNSYPRFMAMKLLKQEPRMIGMMAPLAFGRRHITLLIQCYKKVKNE